MNAETPQMQGSPTGEAEVRGLYQELLAAWNRRSSYDFAALFTADGNVVGFDGSPIDGQAAIRSHLQHIFADHVTARYVGIVREVRLLAPRVALLRAVAGMVPPGQLDLNPAVNTVQALVAVLDAGQWRIALYQNTPAQFHGRPEAGEQLTEELRRLLD